MKRAILALALLLAPNSYGNLETYCYYREVTLAGTAEKLTIQHTTGNLRQMGMIAADVYCSAACVVTLSRSGTAATATAATPTKLLPNGTASSLTVYTASNAGAGTTIRTVLVPAATYFKIDPSEMRIVDNLDNVSISIAAITGDVKIFAMWKEQ